MQLIYMIRDYERMKTEYRSLIDESAPPFDRQESFVDDPTAEKAIQREELHRRLTAVEHGLSVVPKEYQKQIYNNIVHRVPYDVRCTSYRTYGYHKAKMVWTIAKELCVSV